MVYVRGMDWTCSGYAVVTEYSEYSIEYSVSTE
jgi:hypothetical protein